MDNLFSLKNKTILVTGASSGIGKQVSILCAAQGARLIITGRDEAKLHHTFSLLEGEGHNAIAFDLQHDTSIDDLCKQLPELDGVVHSAGLMKLLPLKFIKANTVDEILNINLRAPILLIASLVRHKKLKQRSSVIFMSSINGALIGGKANSIYGATKGGLQSFCKSIAIELSPKKIRVNCVAPGMIETEGVEQIGQHVTNESIEEDKKLYPLARYGTATEVASTCVFLLAEASSFITGTTITIDGGFTAQ